MATMQLQKLQLAKTTTKTAITQKQSLDVVQTLLHGSLSTLSFLRSFFPEKAFDEEPYSMSDRIPSYGEYVNGAMRLDLKTRPQTRIQVLRRNRSRRADVFLDWLEKGAFDALEKGTLRALQIYVHTDAEHRERVIETYTFTIQYHTDGQGGKQPAGLEIDSPGRASMTVETTNMALQTLLRHIMEVCGDLPDLPDERYISMALFYRQEDSAGYQPKGFEPNDTTKLVFALAEGWEKSTETMGDMSSAFHTTSLRVSHLHQPSLKAMASITEPMRIPSQLEYNAEDGADGDLSRLFGESNGKADDNMREDASTLSPSTAHKATTGTSFTKIDQDKPEQAAQLITPDPTANHVKNALAELQSRQLKTRTFTSAVSQYPDGLDTQSSNAPHMKQALQEMMHGERWTQGDTQTQAPLDAAAGRAKMGSPTQELTLDPVVSQKLERQKSMLRRAALQVVNQSKTRKGKTKGDVVLCQCGHEKGEDDMIQCAYCQTWQHIHCYGFSGANDPRLGDVHACYECLLGSNDDQALAQLRSLTLQRRAMSFAIQHGMHLGAGFATNLGIDVANARRVQDYLCSEGFVISTMLSHKPGFAASGKPHFVPAEQGEAFDRKAFDRMVQTLFNPLRHIEKYYIGDLEIPGTVGQQLRALGSANMPPPPTPAPWAKRKTTTTPASGLDLRPSATPYETPMRRARLANKRPFRDDIFATPAKRQATLTPLYRRMKSVQTQIVLNADGLPSSPGI